MSVQALYDAANVLYWKISERQNSTHLAFLKHQNTKTSLYKLSKNHWVIELFKISLSVRRKLQSTLSLDHPVGSEVLSQDQFTQVPFAGGDHNGNCPTCPLVS